MPMSLRTPNNKDDELVQQDDAVGRASTPRTVQPGFSK